VFSSHSADAEPEQVHFPSKRGSIGKYAVVIGLGIQLRSPPQDSNSTMVLARWSLTSHMPKINVPESTRILPIRGSYCAATDPFLSRDDGVETQSGSISGKEFLRRFCLTGGGGMGSRNSTVPRRLLI
jgi:hypothetical protein